MISPGRTLKRRFLRRRRGTPGGDGKRRRRCTLLAALSALAAAAGLALAAPSVGQSPNTWSGTWVNSAPDGSFWVFTQSGQSVGGVWKGSASSGTLSGTIQGDNLSGTLVNNEAGQSASFSITLALDGHSFSGTFTVVGGSTGQWISACTGGACLSNAAPPPPGPPSGGSPGIPTSPKLLAAATAWGQAGPAAALAPGASAIATSPPIGAGLREVGVKLSGDPAGQTSLVVGATKSAKKKGPTPGDCIRVALGGAAEAAEPVRHVIPLDPSDPATMRIEKIESEDDLVFTFTTLMIACLDHLKELEKQATPASLARGADASRIKCQLRARPLSVQFNRQALTVSWRTQRAKRRAPAQLLRSSCRRARNGTVTMKIRTRSRRTKLRKVLGPRLVVGVHRSAAASGTANVQTTFKRR